VVYASDGSQTELLRASVVSVVHSTATPKSLHIHILASTVEGANASAISLGIQTHQNGGGRRYRAGSWTRMLSSGAQISVYTFDEKHAMPPVAAANNTIELGRFRYVENMVRCSLDRILCFVRTSESGHNISNIVRHLQYQEPDMISTCDSRLPCPSEFASNKFTLPDFGGCVLNDPELFNGELLDTDNENRRRHKRLPQQLVSDVALYLDADTIVKDDVGPLITSFVSSGKAIGLSARPDPEIGGPYFHFKRRRDCARRNELLEATIRASLELDFFNAGVMLVNFEEWRKRDISERIARWRALDYDCPFMRGVDQASINLVIREKYIAKCLKREGIDNLTAPTTCVPVPSEGVHQEFEDAFMASPEWNFHALGQQRETRNVLQILPIDSQKILHWSGDVKPNSKDNMMFTEIWKHHHVELAEQILA